MRTVYPTLGIDGDKWYLLDGTNLQKGTSVFADTPVEAKAEWQKQYNEYVELPWSWSEEGEYGNMTVAEYTEARK